MQKQEFLYYLEKISEETSNENNRQAYVLSLIDCLVIHIQQLYSSIPISSSFEKYQMDKIEHMEFAVNKIRNYFEQYDKSKQHMIEVELFIEYLKLTTIKDEDN